MKPRKAGEFNGGITQNLPMTTEIFIANTDTEIESCFPAFSALRSHIGQKNFLAQVRRQQAQSYQIVALRQEGRIKSAAGFRFAEFLAWGKVLYIDDLTTIPGETSKGFAGSLLDWLINHARSCQCQGIHLDTGYARHVAHRLYLRKGFLFKSYHLSLEFSAIPTNHSTGLAEKHGQPGIQM